MLLPDLAPPDDAPPGRADQARARLFGENGELVADSRVLGGPGGAVQVVELPPPDERGPTHRLCRRRLRLDRRHAVAPRALSASIAKAPITASLATSPRSPRAARRDAGDGAIRSDPTAGGLVLSVAVPVQRYKQVLGALMLTTGSGEIEPALRKVRLDLLRIFGVALLVTVLLSIYLAGTIASPIVGWPPRPSARGGRRAAGRDPRPRPARRRDRRSLGLAARDDRRAVAAHERHRALRRRRRARDQEPADLAAQRGRDRGPDRRPGTSGG